MHGRKQEYPGKAVCLFIFLCELNWMKGPDTEPEYFGGVDELLNFNTSFGVDVLLNFSTSLVLMSC